jgi:hypothetical protein
MSGLNDQFFLADDSVEPQAAPAVTIDAFKDTTEPGDVPELRDDLDLIAVATEEFEIKLRDLSLLQDMIRDEGGMSKHVALEAHAIMPDFLNDDRPIEFFTKTPSRTQLTAALEEIGNEKKSLIKRMIDAIVAFIKKIVKRIKDFFIVDEEQLKADQEFANNYKGPTNEDLAKATPKQQAAGNPQQKQGTNTPAPTQAKQSSSSPSSTGGPTVTVTRDEWTEGKMALITAMLGKDRLGVVAAMLSSDFASAFHNALVACDDVSSVGHWEQSFKRGEELAKLTSECNQLLAQAAAQDEKTQRSILSKWVTGKDQSAVHRINEFFSGHPSAYEVADNTKDYLEHLEDAVEAMKNSNEPDAVELVKNIQKLTSQVAAFVSLLVKVDSSYHTVIKGLRK